MMFRSRKLLRCSSLNLGDALSSNFRVVGAFLKFLLLVTLPFQPTLKHSEREIIKVEGNLITPLQLFKGRFMVTNVALYFQSFEDVEEETVALRMGGFNCIVGCKYYVSCHFEDDLG